MTNLCRVFAQIEMTSAILLEQRQVYWIIISDDTKGQSHVYQQQKQEQYGSNKSNKDTQ